MYDAQTEIRGGEKGPMYAQISVSLGTGTFVDSTATFQLLHKDHTVVDNSGSGGTNFTTAQSATISSSANVAYFNLLNTDTSLLPATDYVLGLFTIGGALTGDSIPRIKKPIVQIFVVW